MRGKRGMAVITRYAKSGDLHIAYQVMGRGPLDLVVVPSLTSKFNRRAPGVDICMSVYRHSVV